MSKIKLMIEMDKETYNITRLKIGYWLSNLLNRRTTFPYRLYSEFYEDKRIEECDDCVSRKAVLEVLNKYGKFIFVTDNPKYTDMVDEMANLPSVTPKREQGEWIEQSSNKEQGEREHIWWKCSQCGQVIFSETERDRKEFHVFCSKCGAEMR